MIGQEELRLALLIADRLAQAYEKDRARVAKACDEEVDRSGNLLGWLRDYVMLKGQEKP
jgi:hypothetical protein